MGHKDRKPASSALHKEMSSTQVALFGLIVLMLPWGLALGCQFIHIDDADYVYRNPHVMGGLSWGNITWAFSNVELHFYQPMTWLSLMLDATLMGPQPWGFHLGNVLFHAANTLLVFGFLRQTTLKTGRAFVAAAFFSIHPLRVESVAWVTERKDVLFAFFGLLALLAYVRFVRTRGWKWYSAALVLYVLSLLSKAVLMPLPVLLLLVDYWPLGRSFRREWRGMLLEKVPFALVAGGIAWITLYAVRATSVDLSGYIPLWQRIGNAFVSLVMYLRDTFYFGRLSILYPFEPLPAEEIIAAMAVIGVLTGAVLWAAWKRLEWGRPVCLGWCWFLLTIAPMLGLVQTGIQSRADRFTYFPSIGLAIALTWLWPERFNLKVPLVRMRNGVVAGGLIVAACFTCLQLFLWQNRLALYLSGIEHTRQNWYLMARVGDACGDKGQNELAMKHPEQAAAYFQMAEDYFQRSIAIEPNDYVCRNNFGALLEQEGRLREALGQYRAAEKLRPGDGRIAGSVRRIRLDLGAEDAHD